MIITGEYWLTRAKSDSCDALAVAGLIDGTYVPRRTTQRRHDLLGLSLDSVINNKYRPFLPPADPHQQQQQQQSGDKLTDGKLKYRRSTTVPHDLVKQVLH